MSYNFHLKKLYNLTTSLLIFVLLTACSTSLQPKWIDTIPNSNQALSRIQAEPNQSIAMQKRVALLQAKAELIKRKQLFIYSQLLRTTQCKNEQCKSTLQAHSLQQSKHFLLGAKVVNEYHDTRDGTYYLLLQINP